MGSKRSYGEACRFAYALDLVGERWALLVVRELLLGPKRFTDLREGLPHASPNILSERLRELESNGIVRRRELPPPAATHVYELTEWGAELEPIVTRLGAWGARSPVPPESREIGPDSIVLALRSLFDSARADETEETYELRVAGDPYTVGVAAEELEPGARARLATRRWRSPSPTPAPWPRCSPGSCRWSRRSPRGRRRSRAAKRQARRFLALFPMPEPCPAVGRSHQLERRRSSRP